MNRTMQGKRKYDLDYIKYEFAMRVNMVCAKHNVFYVVGCIETIEIYFKNKFLNSLITAKHNCQFSSSVMIIILQFFFGPM